jgi:hypothetical protein
MERRPSSIAPLVFGYFVFAAATLLYSGVVYIAAIGFREPVPGLASGPLDFVRHVILVPGFFPWLITAIWLATLHFRGNVPRGLGLIFLSIVVHYVVFAYSAHDDVGYRWAQGIEILFAFCALRSLLRTTAESSIQSE